MFFDLFNYLIYNSCRCLLKIMTINLKHYLNNKGVYLDYNAMAGVRPEIIDVVQDVFSIYGNPFAAHSFGRNMNALLEDARKNLATEMNCKPHEVVFTSGGTESNNLAILGMKHAVNGYIFGSTEHESVPNVIPNHDVVTVKMGEIDLEELERLLIKNSPAFVSVMMVNNETGIVTKNIKEAINLTHKYDGIFHTDAVQAVCRMKIDFQDLDVDMLSISSLKSGGIIGSGALLKSDRIKSCKPIMFGRNVESGLRPGTQAAPMIAVFVHSVVIGNQKMDQESAKMLELKNILETEIELRGGFVIGKNVLRAANTSYVVMPGKDQSEQVMMFDMNGIAVSAGSACYKTRKFSQNFLDSIGVSEDHYRSGVRVSMGFGTTENDIREFLRVWNMING
jgi:cysteine desulfurase